MHFNFKRGEYHPSPLLRTIQIILLALIIVGIGLLLTQKMWVPKLVDRILANDNQGTMIVEDVHRYGTDGSYIIDGVTVTLSDGVSEIASAPSSATKTNTRYFGNEIQHDVNSDGRSDRVFLVTQETGGSGVFYYLLAQLQTNEGYRGSHGFFLGDRIVPQSIEPSRQGSVTITYTDRTSDEDFSTPPSHEKSIQLQFETIAMQFKTLEENIEGGPRASTISNSDVLEGTSTAMLANGCFWCVEHDLAVVTGVIDVVSGYAGGTTESPTYKNYAEGGHREVVLVTYDVSKVSYANLVEHIIKHGDPTDSEGSFGDRGPEYAPAIYYKNDNEKKEAYRVIQAIDALQIFVAPLPLLVLPEVKFWPAEDYHQDYAEKNQLRYSYYRNASGRDAFIKKYWGDSAGTFTVSIHTSAGEVSIERPWESFVRPTDAELRTLLTDIQYKVTQEEGTESPFKNAYDKNYAEGIYVDIVSGEPLYFSKDKYDSGTGWPSFVRPIADDVVVLKEDNGLFTTRTEVRSRYADSHLGHMFDDGPKDLGGKRYCMNSAALRFVARADMEKEGYGYLLSIMDK